MHSIICDKHALHKTHTVALQVTCSARGHCNYATGLCQCDAGWEGAACERLACPVTGSGVTAKTCNGRGACLTMTAAAARSNGRNLVRPYVSYTTPWDAHKMQVCCTALVMACVAAFYYTCMLRLLTVVSGLIQHAYDMRTCTCSAHYKYVLQLQHSPCRYSNVHV
jgi:EGF-like domain